VANKRLFVGNLSYSTSDAGLEKAFDGFEVVSAQVIPNRGFGFVELPHEHMNAAIEKMDGATLDGRTIRVNEAVPREDKPRGGGGGRSNAPSTSGWLSWCVPTTILCLCRRKYGPSWLKTGLWSIGSRRLIFL
jgi:RNA recognition motif-containing protein